MLATQVRVKAADLKPGDTLQVRFQGEKGYTKVTVEHVVADDYVGVRDEDGMPWGLNIVDGLLGPHVKR